MSFAYNGTDYVLRNVSFEVRPGERVGIVGATGAGKSTLINLLLRFYDVTSGRILVDGVDVRELDLQALRAKFSLVLQDVHLFSGTVAANIRLGNAAITDDAGPRRGGGGPRRARSSSGCRIGTTSAVAERGATLSVGQKQLLSFARALAFDPEILILDEATSSVDTETELIIRDALKVLMAGRTTLAIAHRLSTIQDMDKILVLHRGELRESGTHQELLAAARDLLQAVSAAVQGSGAAERPDEMAGRPGPDPGTPDRRTAGPTVCCLADVGIGRRGRQDGLALAEQAIDQPGRAVPGIPAHSQDGNHHVAAAQLEGLVAAPDVDVEVPAVDLRAGVHDRVDAVVAVRQPVDLDDRADRQQVGVGGGDARAHVDPRRGRRPSAVAGRREAEPGARSRGGGQLLVGLPGRESGVQNGHLVESREEDDGDRGDEDLAPGRVAQKHKHWVPLGRWGTL